MSVRKNSSSLRRSVSEPGSQPCASRTHSSPAAAVATETCTPAILYCALPHSGQNFAFFGMDLPQFKQNLVAAPGVAAGGASAGASDGAALPGFIALIILWAMVRPAPNPTPIPAAPPPSFPAAIGRDCATWSCV